MSEKLYLLADKILHSTFYILLFTIPFIFSPWNFELFEFNKMLLTYALTVVIVSAWAAKSILSGKLLFQRTLLDLPLLLFLLSQIISTLVSIDPHTSLWGYYTRSHGGLLSTITYLLLYWAFVSNFDKRKTPASPGTVRYLASPERERGEQNAIRYLLSSALIVSVWGILEHFGASPSCLILTGSFDASCWIQDVQNRVFATLGQPNWMAAWLVALAPLSWALAVDKTLNAPVPYGTGQAKRNNVKYFVYHVLPIFLFLALLFTKSRSGILGFGTASLVFWGFLAWINRKRLSTLIRPALILNTSYLILILLFGTPWSPSILEQNAKSKTQKAEVGTVLERGGTESGEIRKIVWKGAIDIWKAYPLFGSGVETFAYSYYNFRPVEHNLTSEWNFLYNKAHNEYLNFLATTGTFGLGAYLLLIGLFLWWSVYRIRNQESGEKNITPNSQFIIHNSLLAGFAGILATNFFGFSVVPVALLFFLYPAMAITLNAKRDTQNEIALKSSLKNILSAFVVLLFAFYVLLRLGQLWYADTLFAKADKEIKTGETETSIGKLEQAISLNPGEPNYYDKLATAYSEVAASLAEENKMEDAQKAAEAAKAATDKVYGISPRNISILKSRASTFNRLALVDETYLTYVFITLERASVLAPTDPITNYNLAIAYYRMGKTKEAIETLEKLAKLKPDYTDAYFALAEVYFAEGEMNKAKEKLEYVLKNINPENTLAKELLKKLQR